MISSFSFKSILITLPPTGLGGGLSPIPQKSRQFWVFNSGDFKNDFTFKVIPPPPLLQGAPRKGEQGRTESYITKNHVLCQFLGFNNCVFKSDLHFPVRLPLPPLLRVFLGWESYLTKIHVLCHFLGFQYWVFKNYLDFPFRTTSTPKSAESRGEGCWRG